MQDAHEDHKQDEEDVFDVTKASVNKETYQKVGIEFPFDLNNLFSM